MTTQLTTSEKELASNYFSQTLSGVTGAIRGMTPTQWSFTPEAGGWSPALIVEHLTFVWERVLGPLRQQLMTTPETPSGPDAATVDSIVIHQFPDRLRKFPAPDFAIPSGRFASVHDASTVLSGLRSVADDYLNTPGLRNHAMDAMPLQAVTNGAYKTLDGFQWFLAATAHAERHTKQILEVRSDSNFPCAT